MSVIEEVKDLGNDLKKGLGDKGFYILIAAAGAFGIYNLIKKDDTPDYVSANGYASYPDVGENSEVVIDAISNEIWASHDEVVGAIETSESEIIEHMDDRFDETNGYIQEGLNARQEIIEKIEDTSQESKYVSIPSLDLIGAISTGNMLLATSIIGEQKAANGEGKTVTVKQSSSKSNSSKSGSSKSSSNKTSSTKNSSTTSAATYNYTTKKGLNTSTSIVDALKASGANSSMSARKEIAEANGIKNYTGTAAQNTKMLNMMKSGNLVKPTSAKK